MKRQTKRTIRLVGGWIVLFPVICFALPIRPLLALNIWVDDSALLLNTEKRGRQSVLVSGLVSGNKRALLIGISQYAHKGGKDKDGIHDLDWWNLHTEYDIELLQKTLIDSKFGFKPENIKILKAPAETTRAAILQALINLISETKEGDIVYIHYSGHGQPAPDKTRPDGMVKTIVPSDYVSQLDTSKNIRGDEIGKLLDQLKAKNPANITITFDSCFSYSAVRGDELPTRGGDPLNLISGGTGVKESENNFLNKLTLPEGYVFLSAANQVQTAKEYYIDGNSSKPIGLFTYALTKAMNNSGPTTTYRDILERASDFISTIRRDQTPQMEGRTEQKLFDGEIAPSDRYIGVTTKTVRASTGTEQRIILLAGMLQGMTIGSKFEIYPAGTKTRYNKGTQDVRPLAIATIGGLDPTTAELKLAPNTDRSLLIERDEKGDPIKNIAGNSDSLGMLRASRAFEIEHNYTSVLKVAVEEAIRFKNVGGGPDLLANLRLDELAAKADPRGKDWNVKIRPPVDCSGERNSDADPICLEERDFHGIVLQRPDGTIIGRIKDDEKMTQNIRDALERESRVFVMRTLGEGSLATSSGDTSLEVKLRIVPVDVEFSDDGKRVTNVIGERRDIQAFESSNPELQAGDYIMLEIQNTGSADAYVTVLDLQPDGKLKPAFPYPGVPHDNLIKRGETYRVPYPYVFRLTEPYGRESFRLIATREATDFSPLLDPVSLETVGRGEGDERGRSALSSPLGKILLNAQKGRRGDLSGIPAEWATYSVTFTVKPPKSP